MMPGPVSDSYDPVFGTSANATEVRDALRAVLKTIESGLGARQYILDVARGPAGTIRTLRLTERERRLIRYALLEIIDIT